MLRLISKINQENIVQLRILCLKKRIHYQVKFIYEIFINWDTFERNNNHANECSPFESNECYANKGSS